jgi:superfamily II DNA/RNA helicase
MEHEQAEQALAEIRDLTSTKVFRNFVAQAHSRAVLQRLGVEPAEWPDYSPTLDENLLYTAHLLFWQGLQFRTLPDFRADGDDLIKQGAEILEFLYAEADPEAPGRIEQLFSAALGYYIAGHYARAYVLMQELESNGVLPQRLELLRQLFLKNLIGLRSLIHQVLDDERYSDAVITAALREGDITEDEALDRVLYASMNRAFSYFVEFPKTGRRSHIERARGILDEGLELTEKVRFVSWWWLFYCARYLFDEFDANSLWTQLGPFQGDDGGGHLVDSYIRASYHCNPPVVELWRPQTKALPRVNEPERRSYCLKMPTSAGKTRVAELAILRFLLDYQDDPKAKCIYVAPFRSLAVEVESSLRHSFHPLGIRVSELYGGFELNPIERLLMERTRIIVATPEKMDAFLRYDPEFANQIRLVIIDEGHIISLTERGVRFEFFLHRLITRFSDREVRFFFLSAVLPNIDEFAAWITGNPDNFIESDWRPSRLMLGELRWNGRIARIDYTHMGHEPLEHDCYISSFIQPLQVEQLRSPRRRSPFPNNMPEVIADAALRFAQQDMTIVFVAQRRSIEPLGRHILKALEIKDLVAKRDGGEFRLPVSEEGRELLEQCIVLAKETMGDDADTVKFLEAGFVVHHGNLPERLRVTIEQLVREQVVSLVVATTTLAQGVNFPIRTVIVHSLQHGYRETLNPLNFWNICGRAGRGMKENEGQVLFAVHLADKDPTRRQKKKRQEAIRQQRREKSLRRKIIEGYRTYRLLSALRQVLHLVVEQWQKRHPNVDVAELCQLLAENNLDWALPQQRDYLATCLSVLDTQLIALTEEQTAEKITPDDLQAMLRRSLLMLQLEAEPEGILTAELANNLLYARLQSIRRRFPVRQQRHRFYQLGFPLSDCEIVENNKDGLLRAYLAAQDYYQWDSEVRCDYLANILELLLRLEELRPDGSSWPKSLKGNWKRLWRPLLRLWLKGYRPDEMVRENEIARSTNSPAEVSLLIDDLFGYRAPWGLNALSVYLQEIAAGAGQDIPEVTSYFSALLKYGVHSPVAGALLAFGLESRKIALKLVERCPNEAMKPLDLLDWFTGLTQQELASFGLTQSEITTIIAAQEEARHSTQTGPRRRRSRTLPITVANQSLGNVQEGDTLVLQVRPDIGNRAFALHTLWGNSLGVFQSSSQIPRIWSSSDWIDVTVTRVRRRSQRSSLSLRVQEV